MSESPKIGDIVKWIIATRVKGAFASYSEDNVAFAVQRSIDENVFAYNLDETGQFNGVVCGKKNQLTHEIVIDDILTTKQGVVKQFMKQFMQFYPDWVITGTCRGRNRRFNNPAKLERRLK